MGNTYQEHLAENATAEQKSAFEKANIEGYAQVLNRFAVNDTQANYQILRDWAAPGVITVDSFIALLRSDPNAIDMSSREQIIRDILDNSHGSSEDLRNLSVRLSTFSLQQLRERRRQIAFKKEVSKVPLAELKAMVANKPTVNQFPGWPALPDKQYVRGKGWITIDATYIESLIKEDFYEFRRLVKLYGPWVDHRRGL